MKRAVMDFWVGLFVAAGIAAVVFLASKASSVNTTSAQASYTLYANFDNIGGLKVRAPIRSAGVLIGRVDSIELDPKTYQAHVALTIDKKYLFSKDSSVEILTSGLLGEQYLGLTTGGDSADLQPGDTIRHASSAIILERLISQFLFGKVDSADAADTGQK
jgi:phospholipid/cholesterol/gamma-HCH transport system substrate-binding protein